MYELKEYSGLIRNHVELAEELGIDTRGMTRLERERAIVLASWNKWGEDLGDHINGQFAIALEDDETGEAVLIRDKLGAELLFYYETSDGHLLHALDIKDFFDKPGFEKSLKRDLVQVFLAFTYVPGYETLFDGVFKVAPGECVRYGEHGLEKTRYWKLSFEPDESKGLNAWAAAIELAMEGSLSDICDEGERSVSFLSGGVDSSYILAKSKAEKGVCVSYEDSEVSEEVSASKVTRWLHRDFEAVEITSCDFREAVDEFLLSYEQPSSDIAGIALYCAAKKVAEKEGEVVCFSGEGADEFFAGYSVYEKPARRSRGYLGATHIMNEAELTRYLRSFCHSRSDKRLFEELCPDATRYDELTSMLYIDMNTYFEGSILFNSIRISRGTGLDIRMPYCDLRMLEVARRMPDHFKVEGKENKIALRRAASYVLPEKTAYREKLGFPVPAERWMRDPEMLCEIERAFGSESAAEFFDLNEIGALLDAFEGKRPRVLHPIWFGRRKGLLWRHVWTIYVFIRWHELFFADVG